MVDVHLQLSYDDEVRLKIGAFLEMTSIYICMLSTQLVDEQIDVPVIFGQKASIKRINNSNNSFEDRTRMNATIWKMTLR